MTKQKEKVLPPFIKAKGSVDGQSGSVDIAGSQHELGNIILQVVDWYYQNKREDDMMLEEFIEDIMKIFDIEISWNEHKKSLFN